MITKDEIQALLQSTETYRVERTVSTGVSDAIITQRPVASTLFREKTIINYPNNALRELMMNACMHRDYQSNMPIRLYQYDDHIKIMNAGGLYGEARPENFPMVNDYRNPIVAEAMKEMKYVNMFNQGVKRVQDMLQENGNKEAVFDVTKLTAFSVEVYSNEETTTQTDPDRPQNDSKEQDRLIDMTRLIEAQLENELINDSLQVYLADIKNIDVFKSKLVNLVLQVYLQVWEKAKTDRSLLIADVLRTFLKLNMGGVTSSELLKELYVDSLYKLRRYVLGPAITAGYIRMSEQDKPKSSKQEYLLTGLGLNICKI